MSDLMDLFRDMSQLHAELSNPLHMRRGPQPSAEIWEEPEHYRLAMDVPGMSRDSLQINVDSNVLSIRGERPRPEGLPQNAYSERRYGSYERSFRLPDGIELDAIEAQLQDGVLSLTLPKRAEVRPRTIEVRIADASRPALEVAKDDASEAA